MKAKYCTLALMSFFMLGMDQCGGRQPGPIPAPANNEACATAEANLKVACPEVAAPTKKGKTFTQWCVETQDNGINLNPLCLVTAKSCSEADACLNDYSNLTDGGK